MSLLQQYNKRKNSPKSYQNGTEVVSNDLDSLIKKYQEGTLNDSDRTLLISELEKYSTTPLNTFENFNKQFFENQIAGGTDFYLNTGLETESDLETKIEKIGKGNRFWGNRLESGRSQWSPRDILTEEDIIQLNEEGYVIDENGVQVYADDSNLVEANRIRGNFVTATGESLFYENSDGEVVPVPNFGGDQTKRANFLKKLAYNGKEIFDKSHVNIAGCGDNMTCITAGTNMLQNSIESWNLAIADPNSPYYIADKKQRKGAFIDAKTSSMSSMSHLKFWGDLYSSNQPSRDKDGNLTNAGRARYNQKLYEQAGFGQMTINRDDFFTKTEGGNMILNPEAIVNFFDKEMTIGNIIGIHGGNHPSHAVSYQGGMFYTLTGENYGKRVPLDFSSEEGREHALNFLQSQINQGASPGTIMHNLQFLSSHDPTEGTSVSASDYGAPYQYKVRNFGEMFTRDNELFYTGFTGNNAYQNYVNYLNETNDLYKSIYTDLSGGESEWGTRQSIDYQNPNLLNKEVKKKKEKVDPEPLREEGEDHWFWQLGREIGGEEGWVPDVIEDAAEEWWPFYEKGGRVLPQSFRKGGTVGSGCSACDAKRLSQRMSTPSFHHGGAAMNVSDEARALHYENFHDMSLLNQPLMSGLGGVGNSFNSYISEEGQLNIIQSLKDDIKLQKDILKSLPRYRKRKRKNEIKDKIISLESQLAGQLVTEGTQGGSYSYRQRQIDQQTGLYPVQLINYPPGYSGMQSGHIESQLLENYLGSDIKLPSALGYNIVDVPVTKDGVTISAGTDAYPSVNAWFNGNQPVTYDPNAAAGGANYNDPNIRTAVINLTFDQLQNYITTAYATTATSGGINLEAKQGRGIGGMIAQLGGLYQYDENGNKIKNKQTGLYELKSEIPLGTSGYDFMKNNCADHTCRAFGVDPNETDRLLGTITDPGEVFDLITSNADLHLVPGSMTGTRLSREDYVKTGADMFGSIPNYVMEDLLVLQNKGIDLEKINSGTFGDLLKEAPNIAGELTKLIEEKIDYETVSDWFLNYIKSTKVSDVVDMLLNPENESELAGIIEAIQNGEDPDAGDLIDILTQNGPIGDYLDQMGILGDFSRWNLKWQADALQNTYQFGVGVVDYTEQQIDNAKLLHKVGMIASPAYKTAVNIVTSPADLANPFKAQSWKNIGPYWKRQLGFEEGGIVNRSYQDGSHVSYDWEGDPMLMNQQEYRNMVQSTYANLFNEEGKFHTPYKPYTYIDAYDGEEVTTDTRQGGNCIHGVCYTLNQILGDYSFLGDGGLGEYIGNENFAENASYEGFLHQADYGEFGIHPGDILQLTKSRSTDVDEMGRPIYRDEIHHVYNRETGEWEQKDPRKIGRRVTDFFGITKRERGEVPGHKMPYHAEVVLDKRVNEDGSIEYLIAHNSGQDQMKQRWWNEQDLLSQLDNGSMWLNSYQGEDGMNILKSKGIRKSHEISGYNENADYYNYQMNIPYYEVTDPLQERVGKFVNITGNINTLDIFSNHYQEIGKMSNLPAHILNQLAVNQLGIQKIESGSGSKRKAGKLAINILDAASPGDLMKKMRERQYQDDIPFSWMSDDGASWKRDLYLNGTVNDEIIGQEIVDWLSTRKIDVSLDDVMGQSYNNIFLDNFNDSWDMYLRYIDRENKLNPYEQKYIFVNQKDSKGDYQQKKLSARGKHMVNTLFPGEDGFSGKDQQFISSLSLAIDNYHLLAEHYPDLNEQQLIDLTTLMHNAPNKALNRDFVSHYLMNNEVDYVNDVNGVIKGYEIIEKYNPLSENVEVTPNIDGSVSTDPITTEVIEEKPKRRKFLGLFEEGGEVQSYQSILNNLK